MGLAGGMAYLRCGNVVVEGFRDQERRGLVESQVGGEV